MRQVKISVYILGTVSCFVTLMLYYWHLATTSSRPTMGATTQRLNTQPKQEKYRVIGTPMKHMPLDLVYEDKNTVDDESFELQDRILFPLLDTPGCKIPAAIVDYEKYLNNDKVNLSCGKRAVFLTKHSGDERKIRVMIDHKILKKNLRKASINYDCCYRYFLKKEKFDGVHKVRYTSCKKINDGDFISLENEFVNVKCFEYFNKNISVAIYDDVYAFTPRISVSENNQTECKDRYNVLMLGMDSMSLPRFVKSLPRTTDFFQQNFWLGYRGYHKVADNTFPNLMAVLTGQNITSLEKKCEKNMDECNDFIMWSQFKKAGYVTAYGEDNIKLPDTFSNDNEFKKPPTDHHMRTFFLRGEVSLRNKLVCAEKLPSGQHLLNYALDFASTYRNESFFGLFWMNSFSHNEKSRPQDADKMFDNFFNQLTYTGILDNTFIIFFSDHGIRYGARRVAVESYYDERMPFMFIWPPLLFKERHPLQYKAMAVNQFRLSTPYDLYNTLVDIKSMSLCRNFSGIASEACPNCHSLFNVISRNRTCQDVAIEDKWCSCHQMYPLDITDTDGMKSVLTALQYIKNRTNTIKTKKCWGCLKHSLKKVVRIHFYYEKSKSTMFHVVAFTLNPANVSFEATVSRNNDKIKLVGTISIISPYRGFGHCTLRPRDRTFCICYKIKNCKPYRVSYYVIPFPYIKIRVTIWDHVSPPAKSSAKQCRNIPFLEPFLSP